MKKAKINEISTAARKDGIRLFLMTIPFLVLIFIFSYMPLWGWRYSLYYYKPGLKLSNCEFVGLKWFGLLFSDKYYRRDMIRVLKNTLGMSFLGLGTSWMPMMFAILLSEVHAPKYKKLVQTLTTVPHFISWVLVYAIAYSMFSLGDGLINKILIKLGLSENGINFLADPNHLWIKMWLWGTWKGLGWGAITYLAAISGIDQQLYDAAMVDGASRWQRIWHVTIPGLIPTFLVLFIISVGNIISAGMEQYLVFSNGFTSEHLEVIDLYVYNQGVQGQRYSYTTAIGMMKSVISIILIMSANGVAKLVRGDSVI